MDILHNPIFKELILSSISYFIIYSVYDQIGTKIEASFTKDGDYQIYIRLCWFFLIWEGGHLLAGKFL